MINLRLLNWMEFLPYEFKWFIFKEKKYQYILITLVKNYTIWSVISSTSCLSDLSGHLLLDLCQLLRSFGQHSHLLWHHVWHPQRRDSRHLPRIFHLHRSVINHSPHFHTVDKLHCVTIQQHYSKTTFIQDWHICFSWLYICIWTFFFFQERMLVYYYIAVSQVRRTGVTQTVNNVISSVLHLKRLLLDHYVTLCIMHSFWRG